MKKKTMKIFWSVLGLISTGFGAAGVILPILPTTPFLLLAMFAFARSSRRLNEWFLGTKLYKKHLEGFVAGRGMTIRTKRTIILSVTAMMALGFILMANVPVGRIFLAAVWVGHFIYVAFIVKTNRMENETEAA